MRYPSTPIRRLILRPAPLPETELFFLSSVFAGLILSVHILNLFLLNGHSEAQEWNIYLSLFTVSPIIIFLFHRTVCRSLTSMTPIAQALFFYHGYLLMAFMCVLWLAPTTTLNIAHLFSITQLTGMVFLLAVAKLFPDGLNLIDSTAFHLGSRALTVLFPVTLITFSLFFSDGARQYFWTSYAQPVHPALREGLLFGALTGLSVLILPRLASRHHLFNTSSYLPLRRRLTLLLSIVIPLLLFDVTLPANIPHYDPYIGPASAVMGGWVPLIDVQGLYGLNYLLFSLLFTFLLPPTYSGAAAVVSLFHVIYCSVFLLIIRRMSTSRLPVFILGVVAVIFQQFIFSYALAVTPSMGGFRFLPPFILLLAIAKLPNCHTSSVWISLSLGLCLFWSLEAAIYGLGTYGAFLLLRNAIDGRPLMVSIRSVALLLATSLGAYFLTFMLLFIISGKFPNAIYLEMITGLVKSTSKTGAEGWSVLVPATSLAWVVFYVPYVVVLAYAVSLIFNRELATNVRKTGFVNYAFPATVLGVLELTYYVGRSFPDVLLSAQFPLALVLLFGVDRIILDRQRSSSKTVILSAGISLVVGVSLMMAVIFERLSYPIGVLTPNSTLLGKCLSDCPVGMVKEIYNRIFVPQTELHQFWGGSNVQATRIREGLVMIRKWVPDERRIILFVPEATQLLFYTGTAHKYPISYYVTDKLSRHLINEIVNAPVSLKDGDIVITTETGTGGTETLDAGWLNKDTDIYYLILARMSREWTLCEVDHSEFLRIYRLRPKTGDTC